MSNSEQFSPFNPDGAVKYYELLQTGKREIQRTIVHHLLTTLGRPVSRNEFHLFLDADGIEAEEFDSWFTLLLNAKVLERRYISGMGSCFVMNPVVRNNFSNLLNNPLFNKPKIPPEEKVGYSLGLAFTESYNFHSSQSSYIDPESPLGIFRKYEVYSIDDIYTLTCRTRVAGIILKKIEDKKSGISQEAASKMRLRYLIKITSLANALGVRPEKSPSLRSLIFEQNLAQNLPFS